MATYSSIKYDFTPPSATTSAQVGAGAMKLIKSIDSDGSDATISFVDGASDAVLDNTYKTYIFKLISIHPENSNPELGFNGSTDSGSNYNVTKTSSYFNTFHNEDEGVDGNTAVQYNGNQDIAQGTGFQTLTEDSGNDADQAVSGELWLFSPSSTTYVKHWLSRFSNIHGSDYIQDIYTAGYFNTTSAIDAIQFKWSAGEIQAGTIKLYGIA